MKHFGSGLMVLALASCIHAPRVPAAAGGELIVVELQPGFMGTTSYTLEVASDGNALLTWSTEGFKTGTNRDRRSFKISANSYKSFSQAFAPFRPHANKIIDYGDPDCGADLTDQPQQRITWKGHGTAVYLQYDWGCDASLNRALVKALTEEPMGIVPDYLKKLPIW